MEVKRKTKKYYRDMINTSYDSACRVFKEAFKKYSPKDKDGGYLRVHIRPKDEDILWGEYGRGCIESFNWIKKQKDVWVELYIQGDSSDTSEIEWFTNYVKKGYAIAKFEDRKGTYREEYTAKQLYQAMKYFASVYLK